MVDSLQKSKPRRIVITGPESSGKTTLVKALSNELKLSWVPEAARSYLEQTSGKYDYSDLEKIAKLQNEQIYTALQKNTIPVLCDTDLLTIKIWSEFKYGKTSQYVVDEIKKASSVLYVLCYPDMPWQADPLRENPYDRTELYEIYKAELKQYQFPFIEVRGKTDERIKSIIHFLNQKFL